MPVSSAEPSDIAIDTSERGDAKDSSAAALLPAPQEVLCCSQLLRAQNQGRAF